MTIKHSDLENRLDLLVAEVTEIKNQLNGLQKKFADLSAGKEKMQSLNIAYTNAVQNKDISSTQPAEVSETPMLDSVSLLSKVSAVCFILVIALILRTFTDNEIINRQTGSYLGMLYASFLLLYGWRMLVQNKKLGSIFPYCGILLMFTIVLETHGSFEAISSQMAYTILFGTFLFSHFVAQRFHLTILGSLSILGSSLVALTIDFPNPIFPLLMLFLYITTLITFKSKMYEPRWGWTGWSFYVTTLFAWFMWTTKIRVPLQNNQVLGEQLYFPWFFPLLFLFAATYMAMSLGKALFRKSTMQKFDMALPTLSIFWAYATAWSVLSALQYDTAVLGNIGITWGAFHFAMAVLIFKLSRIGKAHGAGICVFTFAGAMLLVVSLPDAIGSVLYSLIIWSALGLILARSAAYCEIGGVRLSSYLLQIMACIGFIVSGKFVQLPDNPLILLFIVGSLAVLSMWQYAWCRTHPLDCNVGFFKRIDPSDHSAVSLLVASLVNGYLFLQLAAQTTLTLLLDDYATALLGAQSIIINIGAITLLLSALYLRSKEILSVSILVVIIGALKVFGYDFFESSGVPLVLSVFSFGAVAGVGSYIIKRWQQQTVVLAENVQ